ncbi:hypothetical protein FFLO_00518 [Filobasidium floriforme]|uniref:Coenzyme Q-binding protein COQ10 START domain-containing protein n=1 Tax=Filobasidium floriforme TaxID=5210 RepID=A0A8K0JT01_9TREE|nr:hypothetical protein FFLO_00518 [Filobasidium floriforme]
MSLQNTTRTVLRRTTRSIPSIALVQPTLLSSRQTPNRSERIASPSSRSSSLYGRRSFFSLTDVAKLIPGSSPAQEEEKQVFHARKILPYTQNQLYSLVSDIPSYSTFIPFCTTSQILSSNSSPSDPSYQSSNASFQPSEESQQQDLKAMVQAGLEFDVKAELEVGFGAFVEKFVSRVEGRPGEMVKATVDDSPLFHNLQTTWSFQPASPSSPHPTTTDLTSPSNTPEGTMSPSTSTSSPSVPHPTKPADHNNSPTLLTIDLSFSFANPLHRIASQAFLPKVSDLMVEAFEKRCVQVYGKGKN